MSSSACEAGAEEVTAGAGAGAGGPGAGGGGPEDAGAGARAGAGGPLARTDEEDAAAAAAAAAVAEGTGAAAAGAAEDDDDDEEEIEADGAAAAAAADPGEPGAALCRMSFCSTSNLVLVWYDPTWRGRKGSKKNEKQKSTIRQVRNSDKNTKRVECGWARENHGRRVGAKMCIASAPTTNTNTRPGSAANACTRMYVVKLTRLTNERTYRLHEF
jgi:hypothetical protein